MIGRIFHALLFCLVLCNLYCMSVYADQWVLDETIMVPATATSSTPVLGDVGFYTEEEYNYYFGDDDDEIEEEDQEAFDEVWDYGTNTYVVATGSVATRSVATRSQIAAMAAVAEVPVVYSSYTPYDSSISTTVIQYMSDVLPKLGNVHYVLFRSGQYTYRLVYSKDMQYDNTVFTSDNGKYVTYDTRYYTWSTGDEGFFRLSANNYIVYSDLGDYPMLDGQSVYTWLLIIFAGVFLLLIIYRSMFSVGRVML